MAYLGDDKVLLFGGCTEDMFDDPETWEPLPAETWVYDLSDDTWTLMDPATQPEGRAYHDMAYLGDGKAILYGGYLGGEEEGLLEGTWIYDSSNNTWTSMDPDDGPGPYVFHAMAYIGTDRAVLFGGYNDSGVDTRAVWVFDLSDDTWDYDDPDLDATPSERAFTGMAYFGETPDAWQWVVLFGGQNDIESPSEVYSDTWVYVAEDDTWEDWGWEEWHPATSPSARSKHSIAALQLGYVLLFGGSNAAGNVDDETWVFDASAEEWIEQFTSAPDARCEAGMAKIGMGQALLFGGTDGNANFSDTWVFDAYLPGITVTPTSGLITTESGGMATFDISANTAPDDDVLVPLSSSDLSEGTVLDSVTLPAGSMDPVVVTVTGVDDDVVDGDIAFTIVTGDPESNDFLYDSITADDVADVSVTNWDLDAPRVEVHGDGETIANGDDTPSRFDGTHFGEAQPGTSEERTFSIHNTGELDLELTGDPRVAVDGSSDFTVTDQPSSSTIAPGKSADFTVRCTPSDAGDRMAVVSIRSDDPNDDPYEFTIACSGGTAPEIGVLGNGRKIPNGDEDATSLKGTVFFLIGGDQLQQTFTIENSGDTSLFFNANPTYVTTDHAQFTVSQQPDVEVEAGDTTTFELTFSRGEEAYVEAIVSIWSNDEDQDPYTFLVVGSVDGATAPALRAKAGADQTVLVGSTVVLDGTGSYDTDTASVSSPSTVAPKALASYRWSFKVSGYQANSPVWVFPDGSRCQESSQGFDTAIASFVADKAGTYTLVLEVTNDVGETATDEVTVHAVLEFEQLPGDYYLEDLICFPNPFSDSITFGFEGEGVPDSIEVTIFGLAGEKIWHVRATDASSVQWDGRTLDGERAANGVYLAYVVFKGNGLIRAERMLVFLGR